MSIPDYQSLMLPVLLASSKGEVRIGLVADELADELGLSQPRIAKSKLFSYMTCWNISATLLRISLRD
jgi:hypothetical protein